jgi:hypothetical protein
MVFFQTPPTNGELTVTTKHPKSIPEPLGHKVVLDKQIETAQERQSNKYAVSQSLNVIMNDFVHAVGYFNHAVGDERGTETFHGHGAVRLHDVHEWISHHHLEHDDDQHGHLQSHQRHFWSEHVLQAGKL